MLTDLTQGKPAAVLWRFSLPMLLSVVFQQLYNIVDSVVAGQCIGENALAAVGASYPITMLFLCVATGANIGCSVVTSQLFGAHDNGRLKTAVSTSLLSTVVLAVALSLLGVAVCDPLLALLQTPADIFADARAYLLIYIAGLLFLFLYNICTGVFTALGDSRTPLYFLIASSLGNIALDLLFVLVFHMDVPGVAWATFVAQGISSVLACFALWRRLQALPHGDTPPARFSLHMLTRISVVAIPSILQQSFISVGNLLIQGKVNSLGPAVIAGYAGAVKLNTFAITCFSTLANGVSNFAAQNLGAGKLSRVREGFRAGVRMAVLVVLPFTLLFFLAGNAAMRLFVQAESVQALAVGAQFLKIVSPFYVLIAAKLVADSVLRGAGAMLAFMVATFTDLLLRVALVFVLSIPYGAAGIWASWPVGWTVACLLSVGFYLSGRWARRWPAETDG